MSPARLRYALLGGPPCGVTWVYRRGSVVLSRGRMVHVEDLRMLEQLLGVAAERSGLDGDDFIVSGDPKPLPNPRP